MDCENFTKSWSGHLHFRHYLWYKFHDPSWSGSWDILFTSCNKNEKNLKRAITLQWQIGWTRKKIWVFLIFILIPHTKFQDHISNGFWPSASVTHRWTDRRTNRRTDGRTDRPKPICLPNFFEVGGIKKLKTPREKLLFHEWPVSLMEIEFIEVVFYIIHHTAAMETRVLIWGNSLNAQGQQNPSSQIWSD